MIISPNRQSGFSLLETAVVLVIAGLIIGQFSGLYELILSTDREKKERVNIHKVQASLDTFLAANMFLPCPDVDNDGHEDRSDVDFSCDSREGFLPYKDIGVEGKDAWDNYYYYRVNQQAENSGDIRDVCSSASVMGMGGVKLGADTSVDPNAELRICPDSNIYYCSALGCGSACSPTLCEELDPRNDDTLPPYFHLATPPFGSLSGSYNLKIYNEDYAPYDDSNGNAYGGIKGNGTVAVVISWGANGGQTYRYSSANESCTDGSDAERENCDGDRVVVDTRTGENRDYITWTTVNQAKMAIIYNGEFR